MNVIECATSLLGSITKSGSKSFLEKLVPNENSEPNKISISQLDLHRPPTPAECQMELNKCKSDCSWYYRTNVKQYAVCVSKCYGIFWACIARTGVMKKDNIDRQWNPDYTEILHIFNNLHLWFQKESEIKFIFRLDFDICERKIFESTKWAPVKGSYSLFDLKVIIEINTPKLLFSS